MNDELITVTLARDELLLALNLLQAEGIPGLDADPFGEMREEQRTVANIVAGRALRARGLARVNGEGNLALHGGVLTAVGTCAYAQSSLFLFHWTAVGETPNRYFAHLREEEIVAHTRPEDVLHLFTILPSRERLWAHVFDFCSYEEGAAEDGTYAFTVSSRGFIQARELAQADKGAEATAVLREAGADDEAAQALVGTLSSAPRVTVAQTLQQVEEGVQKRDFTVVQDGQHTWLLIPAVGEESQAPLRIKTTNKAEIEALLADSLA